MLVLTCAEKILLDEKIGRNARNWTKNSVSEKVHDDLRKSCEQRPTHDTFELLHTVDNVFSMTYYPVLLL